MLASGSKDGVILLWDLESATGQSTYGHRLLPPEIYFAGEFAPGIAHAAATDAQGFKFIALGLEHLSQSNVSPPLEFHLPRVFRPPNISCVYDRTNTLSLWEIREVAKEVFRA